MSNVIIVHYNPANNTVVAERHDGRQYDVDVNLFENQHILTVYAVGRKRKINVDERPIGIEIAAMVQQMIDDNTAPYFLYNDEKVLITNT